VPSVLPVLVVPSKEWQNKQQSGMQPRLLHDVDGIVLLISRTYICATGHRFLSHDPQVLDCLNCILCHAVLLYANHSSLSLITKSKI
jgi:hypothetical protein